MVLVASSTSNIIGVARSNDQTPRGLGIGYLEILGYGCNIQDTTSKVVIVLLSR